MKAEQYFDLKAAIIEAGYAHEIDWIANIEPCTDAHHFSCEATWVILNSGMKEQIARQIWERIQKAWGAGKPTASAFGHKGKVDAINYIRGNKQDIFEQYCVCLDQLEFLESLPFIGKITKYHLAKNLGMDVVKPDRHLVRIAKQYNFDDCFKMCQYLRSETGDKLSLIDMVIWRAANLGLV